MYRIPFNRPCLTGNELKYIEQAIKSGKIAGDGMFAKKCSQLLEEKFQAKKVLLTGSGTHALEIASMLLDLKERDEVICPSYTFPSTVNSFGLQGAKPVFVDIRPDTLNIDENKIEERITGQTKAIFPVHYAGVGAEMNKIKEIANKNKLFVVEDAAQGVNTKYKGKYLGTIGHMGAYSFHETKNYICGEGGALIINDESFIDRAEIIREKGTNRSAFFRGQVDEYTWCDTGSSYLPSEIQAAFLFAQLEHLNQINEKRRQIFEYYFENFTNTAEAGLVRLPVVPLTCDYNYHMFYLLLNSKQERDELINSLKAAQILSVFHYVPLHLSPMGTKLGYKKGDLPITEDLSNRLIRLPFYNDMTLEDLDFVVKTTKEALRATNKPLIKTGITCR